MTLPMFWVGFFTAFALCVIVATALGGHAYRKEREASLNEELHLDMQNVRHRI